MNWGKRAASLVGLNEPTRNENEERCERLPQSKGSSIAPMVADYVPLEW